MAKPKNEHAEAGDHSELQQQLLEANDSELMSAIAKKRLQIKDAKSDHGKTGRAVASLNEELEILLLEADKREARRQDRQEKLVEA